MGLILFELFVISLSFLGCREETRASVGKQGFAATALPCAVTYVLPPVSNEEFSLAYAGRSFYADGNHLGYDIGLPEGTRIHPVACGAVRISRPAAGYGQRVVVLEHGLPRPVTVTNGEGQPAEITRFLSIYGHLRPSQDRSGSVGKVEHAIGDGLDVNDVIGYVDRDATNGDGAEHLHVGIRLQSMDDAKASDTQWFRGYDTTPSQRKWFGDPAVFLEELRAALGPSCVPDEPAESPVPIPTTEVPPGLVHFVWEGEPMAGIQELHGSWDPPGPGFIPWGPEATVQCPDVTPNDGRLDCLLAMPGGTTMFSFTVQLPNGSWWGDMSDDPLGGHGETVGTVTLTGPYGPIGYDMVDNGTGPDYYNGFVSVIP